MSIWNSYPSDYRHQEVQTILNAVTAGECVSVVGLSGAGKSNLMGFLVHRVDPGPKFYLIDCNDLPAPDSTSLFNALIETLGGQTVPQPTLLSISRMVKGSLEDYSAGICFLFDRFDMFNRSSPEMDVVASNLRSLRDRFKYSLTYVIATRTPLDTGNELSELFYANTLWLGSLTQPDSQWSISQYASRKNLNWDGETIHQIYTLSRGYPSMLRAVCEAYAAGVPLDLSSLRNSIAVRRRVEEFWADSPSEYYLQQAGLEDHPLLCAGLSVQGEDAILTSTEQRLLDYFTEHPDQVCEKDELIQAVWPEEKVITGLRDDSLAQLVHRLRVKIDTPEKKHIQTITGRGYRYRD